MNTLWLYTLCILSLSCHRQAIETANKPNIIIFFTDDQGYADLGCYGAEGFSTPHIDQLAEEGIKFTNFYVPATVCTPSRAGLLTGRYPKRSNLHEAVLFPYSDHGLPLSEYTMAEMLKDKGYTTSCIGKWHLGHQEKYMPLNQGFDQFFGVPYSNDMDGYYYKHNNFQAPPLPLFRNKEIIEEGPDQAYFTQRFTEEAIKQIQRRNDKPFFIYLAHNMPHIPIHASPEFIGKSELGLYGDVIMELDWSVGEIVSTLKEEGIYDNTIFIFTSDNGPDLGSALPLRGKKAQTWEGGQRVPGIIMWKDKIPSKSSSDEMVNTMDLMPTLAAITQANIPEGIILDGMDITPLLMRPETTKLPERSFFYFARNGDLEAVRLGKWKLHLKKSSGWNAEIQGEFLIALYDLENDIGETTNIAELYPDIVEKLEKRILDVNF
ncbi:MAG: sulfatase [Flavobacteriaceae bacterium]